MEEKDAAFHSAIFPQKTFRGSENHARTDPTKSGFNGPPPGPGL
jgi:hypothetical protein